jgi:hypothetical protein
MATDWDTFWSAAAALGTVGAVVVALGLARADFVSRRKERERAQAERISGWMDFVGDNVLAENGLPAVKLMLVNASNQLVYNLIASIVTAHGGSHPGSTLQFRTYVGRLPPGKSEYSIDHPGHGMSIRFSIELAFDDSGGRTWVRHGRGKLEQIKTDPLSYYDISPPVGWLMP